MSVDHLRVADVVRSYPGTEKSQSAKSLAKLRAALAEDERHDGLAWVHILRRTTH